MLKPSHRTVRRVLAIPVAAVALMVGFLLSAAPALAQVLPPEPVTPAGGHDSSGTSPWTFVLLACVLLVVGAALSYGLTRFQKSRTPQLIRDETPDRQLSDVNA